MISTFLDYKVKFNLIELMNTCLFATLFIHIGRRKRVNLSMLYNVSIITHQHTCCIFLSFGSVVAVLATDMIERRPDNTLCFSRTSYFFCFIWNMRHFVNWFCWPSLQFSSQRHSWGEWSHKTWWWSWWDQVQQQCL